LCGSPAYFEKHGIPNPPTDLNKHQWVLYKLTSGTLELSKGTRSFSIEMKSTISTNNAAARTAFVEGGHGLGRIPVYDAKPKIQNGTLMSVLDDYAMKDIHVYGVFPPGNSESKKLRLLIDYLKVYFLKRN